VRFVKVDDVVLVGLAHNVVVSLLLVSASKPTLAIVHEKLVSTRNATASYGARLGVERVSVQELAKELGNLLVSPVVVLLDDPHNCIGVILRELLVATALVSAAGEVQRKSSSVPPASDCWR
jgi:hypothetical protein